MSRGRFQFCPTCASALTSRQIEHEQVERIACTQCDFIHYDNPTPVIAAIVERGEEVVLVRSIGWPEEWFGLVTGFLERGEHPEQGIVREVAEELGLTPQDVTLGEFVGLFTFERMNQLIIAYHVVIPADHEIVLDTRELEAFKLVPIHKLRPWPFGTGEAVKRWLESRP